MVWYFAQWYGMVVLQESVHKSTHSTCSDGSLLSMASSEMDEVSSITLSILLHNSNVVFVCLLVDNMKTTQLIGLTFAWHWLIYLNISEHRLIIPKHGSKTP